MGVAVIDIAEAVEVVADGVSFCCIVQGTPPPAPQQLLKRRKHRNIVGLSCGTRAVRVADVSSRSIEFFAGEFLVEVSAVGDCAAAAVAELLVYFLAVGVDAIDEGSFAAGGAVLAEDGGWADEEEDDRSQEDQEEDRNAYRENCEQAAPFPLLPFRLLY